MTEKKENKPPKKGHGSFALGAAIAGVIGAGLGILFAPKSGQETREDVKRIAHQTARKFRKSRVEVEEIIQEVFGKVTEPLIEQYVELKGEVLAMVHQTKTKGIKKFSKDLYDKLVDETVETYAKAKKWSKEQQAKMSDEIKQDWGEDLS